MRPEEHIKEDIERNVDRAADLTLQEQKFLTLYRELSESDKSYLVRVAEVMARVKTPTLK